MLKKRIFSFIVATIMIVNMGVLAVGADNNIQLNRSNEVKYRMLDVFEDKLEEAQRNRNMVNNLQISAIKQLIDFDGNSYILVESDPIGYMIYSEDTGVFVEEGSESPSPYKGYTENLYYGGPTYYFVKQDDEYIFTLAPEERFTDDDGYNVQELCQEFHQQLQEMEQPEILDYIEKGDKKSQETYNSYMQQSLISPMAVGASEQIKNTSFFSSLNNCGYAEVSGTGGICGFIGLNMVIAYHARYKNSKIMDSKYWSNSSKKDSLVGGNNSLSKYLYNLDPKDGTTSMHIHNVMKKYAKARNVSVGHQSLYLPGAIKIKEALKEDRPVVLFGSMKSAKENKNMNHAVVVYKAANKVNTSGVNYTAHFGWNNYTNVVLANLTIGSMYTFS